MVTILWFQIPLPPGMEFLGAPLVSFILTALAWILIAVLVNFILSRLLHRLFRNLPGEIEDIVLGILRRPLLIAIFLYGSLNSLHLLSIETSRAAWFFKLVDTLLILVAIHTLWRIFKDILVYYGEKWARRTDSRIDDILIPFLNLFGPIVIFINAALIILPLWGIDIASVLVGAGIIGLVLGLALQDTLSNVFSGMSLLIEAPFRTGDLVILSDGKTCRVDHTGLRSTQFYSINDHATVFVPNRLLSSTTLNNITKPTLEQRLSIDLTVSKSANLLQVQQSLVSLAQAHPCVVVSDMGEKIRLLRQRIELLQAKSAALDSRDENCQRIQQEIMLAEQAIPKLEITGKLNSQALRYVESLRDLIRGIKSREMKGLSQAELQEIREQLLLPADEHAHHLTMLVEEWTLVKDPWIPEGEYWDDRKLWDNRSAQFLARWERLKKEILRPREHLELRLDDLTKDMISWLEHEFMVLPAEWKNPRVTFQSFSGSEVEIRLWFLIDNIRQENYSRADRVKTELARQLRDLLCEAEVW